MEAKLQELKQRLLEINDLNSAIALLSWDQTSYMPEGGAEARGRQLALLSRLSHEKFTDVAMGRLLDALQPYAESLPYDSDDAALIRLVRRQYDLQVKVPNDFVAELSEHGAESYQRWTHARPANDFQSVRPILEKTLDLSRRLADFFAPYDHIADPLINFADYGMKAESVSAVFAQLRTGLVPLVKAILDQPPFDDSFIYKDYPAQAQLDFGLGVIKDYGFDFTRGRQDLTHHPFMTKFSIGDVRILTHVKPNDVRDALYSTLHECGHALYELGIDPAYEGTPLNNGTSAGVHESQSRTWENIVGRSREFWQYYYPKLQATFPDQLRDVSLDQFYRAVNKVERSLIRIDADEVTYNLHVMIRFDLEMQLLDGRLEIKDLPEAWDERYQSDIGISSPNYSDGVLQDVHWYQGIIGGVFQGYTLGNIMSAQFYDAALKAHPNIPAQIAQGQFGTLHGWLKDNIYQYGSKYTASEILQRVTGSDLNVEPLLTYLRGKFGALYTL
ncbi:MAG TPA: carboxypeptidase M32 [Phototrophicaceae bacterium]|nr:carboxypeptidase M32 [Phototrophicaceae bacterium]